MQGLAIDRWNATGTAIRLADDGCNVVMFGQGYARQTVRNLQPRIEVYSIDESFLDLSDVAALSRVELARDLCATVRAWTGIPTCVGIGPTKTLANHIAKSVPALDGVCDLTDAAAYDHWLCRVAVGEVWGIGRASLAKLEAMGVESVADLRDFDPRPVRKWLTDRRIAVPILQMLLNDGRGSMAMTARQARTGQRRTNGR